MNEANWLGSAPEYRVADAVSTYEADVVVVGAGIAGISIARSAAESGLSVLVLEQTGKIQIRGLCFGAVDAGIQKKAGVVIDRAGLLADWMQYSGNRANALLVRRFITDSGRAYDWFEEALDGEDFGQHISHWPNPPYFDNQTEYYRQYQTSIEFVDWIGACKKHYERSLSAGAEYLFHAEGKALHTQDGRVAGVFFSQPEQELCYAAARKAVVMATGDYGANEAMVKALCPEFYRALGNRVSGIKTSTGEGHKMAIWAGGVMEPSPHAHMDHAFAGGFFGLGNTAALQLNQRGIRYMNEDVPGQSFTNQVIRQPGGISWQIWEEATMRDMLAHQSIGHGNKEYCLLDDETMDKMIADLRKELDPATATGRVFAAWTLPELLDKIGLPKERALAEIARYNELVHKGVDEDFGKRSDRLYPIEQAPFYAARAFVAPGVVTAGVMVDENMQVIREDGSPIEGLFAIGNVAGGRYAVDYPTNAPATSHGTAVTFGLWLGEYLAGKA